MFGFSEQIAWFVTKNAWFVTEMKKNEEQKAEFARLVVQGMDKKEAYRKAFGASGKSENAVRQAVFRLSQDVTVLRVMEELGRERDAAAVVGRREILERLSEQFRKADNEGDRQGMVKIVAEINKMTGGYEPEKVEVSGEWTFARLLKEIDESSR